MTETASQSPPAKAPRTRKRWIVRLLAVLAILGPGLIAANAGNDAGGVLTYASAGSQFGYRTLFLMVLITVALVVVQEMCSRLGVYTGEGLGGLIREQFSARSTFGALVPPAHRQRRPHGQRVRRGWGGDADLRGLPVHLDPDRRSGRVGLDRPRHVLSGREIVPHPGSGVSGIPDRRLLESSQRQAKSSATSSGRTSWPHSRSWCSRSP